MKRTSVGPNAVFWTTMTREIAPKCLEGESIGLFALFLEAVCARSKMDVSQLGQRLLLQVAEFGRLYLSWQESVFETTFASCWS